LKNFLSVLKIKPSLELKTGVGLINRNQYQSIIYIY